MHVKFYARMQNIVHARKKSCTRKKKIMYAYKIWYTHEENSCTCNNIINYSWDQLTGESLNIKPEARPVNQMVFLQVLFCCVTVKSHCNKCYCNKRHCKIRVIYSVTMYASFQGVTWEWVISLKWIMGWDLIKYSLFQEIFTFLILLPST